MNLVQVYVHGSYSRGEVAECYEVSTDDAETIYNMLYEVELIVDLETKQIVGVNGRKVSDEAISLDT